MLVRNATKVLAASSVAAGATLAFARYRRWHLRWGATDEEAGRPMAGDELVARPQFAPTRAITVDAPPDAVWPWLVQLGYGRAGWYSYDCLDNLGHGRSADEILSDLQDVQVGDVIPMGPVRNDDTVWTIEQIDAPKTMVWSKPAATWTWRLEELPGDRTRLVTRIRVRYRARPTVLSELVLLELGDFWMMRKELRSIKERAERETRAVAVAA
jgi:hypothetical protein